MKLSEIALRVGAQLQNCTEDVEINAVAQLEEARAGEIAYVENPRFLAAARTTRASALIVRNEFIAISVPTLRCDYPFLILTRVLELLYGAPQYEAGVHPTAVVHPSAKIGLRASIGAYVVIDRDAEIGDDAVLLPHVVIYRGARIGKNFFAHAHAVVREYCRLGNNVILQNGAVVGADGFGFARDQKDNRQTLKNALHAGRVVLGDGVEVQTNACIQRALAGETRIGHQVKIGDLVVIGHGTSIDDYSILGPQVGVAGEVRVGKHVNVLGQSGVVPYCRIGDRATVTIKSGVVKDVEAGHVVSGFPALDNQRWLRSVALFKRLPELARQLYGPSGRSPARKKRRTLPPKQTVVPEASAD